MTSRAPAWFEMKYKAGAIMHLQSRGFILKDTYTGGTEIKGNQVTWKIAGTGEAVPLADAIEEVPVMNADRSTVVATFGDWQANDWIKKSDLNKMSENEQQVVQKTCAMAMGRRFDRGIVQALDAETGNTTIGDGTTAIGITDIMNAMDTIYDIGVGEYEFFCALPQKFMRQLMLYKEFSNSQWVGPEYPLLKKLGAKVYENCTFIPMPSKTFTSSVANSVDAYMWVKDALGFEWNNQLESRIDYVATKKAYLAANDMGCVAQSLLPEGSIRLRFATNVALTRPT